MGRLLSCTPAVNGEAMGNPGALRRWMVVGAEIARIMTEFEERAFLPQNKANINVGSSP